MKKILFLAIILNLVACSNLETIEVKNDAGVLTEVYTRKKDDFAKEGIYKAFDDNGVLIEEANYKNDTLHGERKIYHENGTVQAIEQYQNGLFEGKWQSFTPDGALELEGNYVNNKMAGIWKRYYNTGKTKEEVTFVDNNENGPFVEYYENGNKKAEGNYMDGDNEHGKLKLYRKDGTLERKMNCNVGLCRTVWQLEETN